MARYLFRRALQGVAIVLIVATITFTLVHLAPGEPYAELMLDPRVTPAMRAALRESAGLDLPLSEQYVRFLSKAARGDFGESLARNRPVRTILAEALPRTLLLMSAALGVGFALGVGVGAWQASRAGSRTDRALTRASVTLAAVPDFWLALALFLVFGYHLRWFPLTGMTTETLHAYLSPAGRVLDVAKHLVLPASSLALIIAAVVARYQRAAILDVLPDDYVRTARAKGVAEGSVLRRHAFRNALIPIITLFGLALPSLVGGAVFVEKIFAWPGMGLTAVDALGARDYPVVLGTVFVTSVVVVIGSFVTDVLYAAADPRLRGA